jgi:transaldolase
MKFFIDTADIAEIEDLAASGLVDGVTTNPSLVAKAGKPIREVIAAICAAVEGPVSAEVTATDFDGMMEEGQGRARSPPNHPVQVPHTRDGLQASRAHRQARHPGTVTR